MQVLVLLQYANLDYVSKMVYSKDKDLIFVYKPDGIWNETEYVHEVHHLEQMVPYAVGALKDHPLNKDDGIMTVYDMAQKENLKLYNEDKYWNLDLKDEFMGQTRTLWQGNFSDKRNGSIFQIERAADDDEALTVSTSLRSNLEFVPFTDDEGQPRVGRCCCQARRGRDPRAVRGPA